MIKDKFSSFIYSIRAIAFIALLAIIAGIGCEFINKIPGEDQVLAGAANQVLPNPVPANQAPANQVLPNPVLGNQTPVGQPKNKQQNNKLNRQRP